MTRVGFFAHGGREAAVEASLALQEALAADGVEAVDLSAGAAPVDLVVAVGGDGTFLRAALLASQIRAPILGVKVGRLGFLTEVEPSEALAFVRRALAGEVVVEERLAVVAEPEDGGTFPPQWAMNEVMVEKRARHRLIRLRMEVDGAYITTFSADGVIVATPTGSTAYSFAARGPIVTPEVPCLVVTPVAAHMVFDRSFVLGASQVVVLQVDGEEPGLVSADGRDSQEVPVGARIRIRTSNRPVRFVHAGDSDGFLPRVRERFGLPGDPAAPDAPGGDVVEPEATDTEDVGGSG